MPRFVRRVAAASSLLVSLYACSDSSEPGDGGSADDGSLGAGGPRGADGSSADGAPNAATDDADVNASDAAAPPTHTIRFVGRRDTSDPTKPKFSWAGARIIARFTGGTEVKVTFDESALDGTSHWDVLLDGVRTSTLALVRGMSTYSIASVDGAEHTIELYKRTEALVSSTRFIDLELVGGTLLAPPATLNRRIEFIGDSISNGYGDECASANEAFSPATENERLAFTGLVAHDLQADHHNISYSGKGVVLNYTRSNTEVMPSLYPRISPMEPAGAANLWTFATDVPDVVWINLGTNDWSQDRSTEPWSSAPDTLLFTPEYIKLVTFVRSNYPNAHIFVSLASSINDAYPSGWEALTNMRAALTDIVTNRANAGDAKIYKFEFDRAVRTPAGEDELTGCAAHPNMAAHRKMANQAIAQIKAKTLWP